MSGSCIRLTPVEADRLVNRLKNTNLEKFYTLCKMHLSFLLHLPGPSLDDFLGQGPTAWGNTSTPQSSDKNKFRHFVKRKSSKDKENRSIEMISPVKQEIIDQIMPLINYLSQEKNLKQEGLFRKSGHIGRRQLLREKLLAGENVSVELEGGVYSAHDCASVLKTALSELPEPLLTEKLYLAHCQVTEMEDEKKQLQTLQLLLQLLPTENLHLLRQLLALLHKVVSESSNKMTSETLGTLFAPHLLVPRKMSASELQAVTPDLTKTVAFMIDNLPQLFKLPEPLIRDIATYWSQMEVASEVHVRLLPSPDEDSSCKSGQKRRCQPGDIPITTSVTFADREASSQAAENTDTQVALAQLYAHVSSMPDSSKKRRLMKQFQKSNGMMSTPPTAPSNKHKRTKSFGDSIKKLVSRNHNRRPSCHSQFQENIPPVADIHTPTATPTSKLTTAPVKLFHKEAPEGMVPTRSLVHIVDMKENRPPYPAFTPLKRKSPCLDTLITDSPTFSLVCSAPFSAPISEDHSYSHKRLYKSKNCDSMQNSTPDRRFDRSRAYIKRTLTKGSLAMQETVSSTPDGFCSFHVSTERVT